VQKCEKSDVCKTPKKHTLSMTKKVSVNHLFIDHFVTSAFHDLRCSVEKAKSDSCV